MSDLFDLQRFIDAQAPVFELVCGELRGGRKRTHWMWFIFPQIAGLGHSATSQYFALSGLAEAACYAGHAVLGARLLQCTDLVNGVQGASAAQIFGFPDELKFHASMTLFRAAAPGQGAFDLALARYFGGAPHLATLERLDAVG